MTKQQEYEQELGLLQDMELVIDELDDLTPDDLWEAFFYHCQLLVELAVQLQQTLH